MSLTRISIVLITTLTTIWAIDVVPKIRLNSGRDCPMIGLGMGGLRTGGPPQSEKAIEIVKTAIRVGYRHFDTAFLYGNEAAIGQAINEMIGNGTVKRQDLFITTKISSKRFPLQTKEEAFSAVLQSLQNLNQSYVDLMLIHFPANESRVDQQIWKALEDSVNLGLVKSIGVSNFNVSQLNSLIKSANVLPAMNQIESYPGLNQNQVIRFCSAYKTRVTAYSPLGAGTLVNDPVLSSIGHKYGKTAAQVMIRWQLQRGVVVIPKSTKAHRIEENFNAINFELSTEDMKAIDIK